jgi:hypothetical protein
LGCTAFAVGVAQAALWITFGGDGNRAPVLEDLRGLP